MRHLIIKNIGPVVEVDIELKRINVLIGLQSSGKSTINKIACYCSWVEKEIATTQSADYFLEEGVFESRLVVFHKLAGFILADAVIQYETEVMRFSFSKKENRFSFEWKEKWNYVRPKMIYIPAERNVVASIPNWFEVKLEENNIRSFMQDWEEARTYYGGEQLEMLHLGVRYAFDPASRKDRVFLSDDKSIDFTNTSSGLQSLIPLMVVLQYVSEDVFSVERKDSTIKDLSNQKLIDKLYSIILSDAAKIEDGFQTLSSIYSISIRNRVYEFMDKQSSLMFQRIARNLTFPQFSNIFLEEPEQNLFPFTQRDLVKHLINLINKERKHHLFITTHSPYILTSLNNLLYAGKVGELKGEAVNKIISENYWIQFAEIGAWFVADGRVSSILDKEQEMIKAEAVDGVSSELNREFDQLMDLELDDVD